MDTKSKRFKITYVQTVESEIDFEYPVDEIEVAYLFLDKEGFDHLGDETILDEEVLEIEPIE